MPDGDQTRRVGVGGALTPGKILDEQQRDEIGGRAVIDWYPRVAGGDDVHDGTPSEKSVDWQAVALSDRCHRVAHG